MNVLPQCSILQESDMEDISVIRPQHLRQVCNIPHFYWPWVRSLPDSATFIVEHPLVDNLTYQPKPVFLTELPVIKVGQHLIRSKVSGYSAMLVCLFKIECPSTWYNDVINASCCHFFNYQSPNGPLLTVHRYCLCRRSIGTPPCTTLSPCPPWSPPTLSCTHLTASWSHHGPSTRLSGAGKVDLNLCLPSPSSSTFQSSPVLVWCWWPGTAPQVFQSFWSRPATFLGGCQYRVLPRTPPGIIAIILLLNQNKGRVEGFGVIKRSHPFWLFMKKHKIKIYWRTSSYAVHFLGFLSISKKLWFMTRCQIWGTIELHRDPISKMASKW